MKFFWLLDIICMFYKNEWLCVIVIISAYFCFLVVDSTLLSFLFCSHHVHCLLEEMGLWKEVKIKGEAC